MKLLMESWKKYLKEVDSDDDGLSDAAERAAKDALEKLTGDVPGAEGEATGKVPGEEEESDTEVFDKYPTHKEWFAENWLEDAVERAVNMSSQDAKDIADETVGHIYKHLDADALRFMFKARPEEYVSSHLEGYLEREIGTKRVSAGPEILDIAPDVDGSKKFEDTIRGFFKLYPKSAPGQYARQQRKWAARKERRTAAMAAHRAQQEADRIVGSPGYMIKRYSASNDLWPAWRGFVKKQYVNMASGGDSGELAYLPDGKTTVDVRTRSYGEGKGGSNDDGSWSDSDFQKVIDALSRFDKFQDKKEESPYY